MDLLVTSKNHDEKIGKLRSTLADEVDCSRGNVIAAAITQPHIIRKCISQRIVPRLKIKFCATKLVATVVAALAVFAANFLRWKKRLKPRRK